MTKESENSKNNKGNKVKVTGTLGLENSLYQNERVIRYDAAGKKVLRHKEVLANILKYSVPEYSNYSCEEIMSFIEGESISSEEAIAPDTDTRIMRDDTVQTSIGEANLAFDVKFRVVKPVEKKVHLHIDIELQGKTSPGYSLEKRGIYHLSRMISSQLEVVNKRTNYDKLEKAYCIFICVGEVPKYLWNTVSYCEFVNTKNIGDFKIKPENLDLMGLVFIRIGEVINENVTDIIHFLHGLFYDMEEVKEYIDFSKNEEFRKELGSMAITGEHLIIFGQHLEQEKTKEAKEEAKRAKEEAKKAKEEVKKAQQEAESKVKEAESKTKEAEKRAETLERELEELRKRLGLSM